MKADITYFCGCSEDRLRRELPEANVTIVTEREVQFTDGTTRTQFTIKLPNGIIGHLVPASRAAIQRQLNAGRYLDSYSWVYVQRDH